MAPVIPPVVPSGAGVKMKRPVPPNIQTNGASTSTSSPSPAMSAKKPPQSAKQPSASAAERTVTPSSVRPVSRTRREPLSLGLGRNSRNSVGNRAAFLSVGIGHSDATLKPSGILILAPCLYPRRQQLTVCRNDQQANTEVGRGLSTVTDGAFVRSAFPLRWPREQIRLYVTDETVHRTPPQTHDTARPPRSLQQIQRYLLPRLPDRCGPGSSDTDADKRGNETLCNTRHECCFNTQLQSMDDAISLCAFPEGRRQLTGLRKAARRQPSEQQQRERELATSYDSETKLDYSLTDTKDLHNCVATDSRVLGHGSLPEVSERSCRRPWGTGCGRSGCTINTVDDGASDTYC